MRTMSVRATGVVVGDQPGQVLDLPGRAVPDEANPHRGVDDGHRTARLSSRSPSHRTVPRSCSTWCRSLRRTSSRRANSTVAFLPLVPATACPLASSPSSISMLVRTTPTDTFRMEKCGAHPSGRGPGSGSTGTAHQGQRDRWDIGHRGSRRRTPRRGPSTRRPRGPWLSRRSSWSGTSSGPAGHPAVGPARPGQRRSDVVLPQDLRSCVDTGGHELAASHLIKRAAAQRRRRGAANAGGRLPPSGGWGSGGRTNAAHGGPHDPRSCRARVAGLASGMMG